MRLRKMKLMELEEYADRRGVHYLSGMTEWMLYRRCCLKVADNCPIPYTQREKNVYCTGLYILFPWVGKRDAKSILMEKAEKKVKKLQTMSHEELLAVAENMFHVSVVFETRRCEGPYTLYRRLVDAVAGDATKHFLNIYLWTTPCSSHMWEEGGLNDSANVEPEVGSSSSCNQGGVVVEKTL